MSDSYDEIDFSQANELVKGRQRFQRRPKRSAELLGKLMARKGYGQTNSAQELDAVWNSIVGSTWQTKTKVGLINRGVLEVIVSNSGVNQQLEFKKKQLLAEIQKRLPQNKIKGLRFRIGNVA